MTEWRKQRDAGVLDNARPGAKVARLTPEQAEIARLRRELEVTSGKLARTEVALPSWRHVLLDDLSKSTGPDAGRDLLMGAYRELVAASIPTRLLPR